MAGGGIRIPAYPAGGTIQPQGVPGGGSQQIDAGQGDFGGAMGRGLQQFGQRAQSAAKDWTREMEIEAARDNETAAMSLDGQLRAKITSLIADPEKGFLAKKGRDAADAYKDTFTALEKLKAEHLELAGNPDQRRMLEKLAGHRIDTAVAEMNSHTRVQRAAWQDATFAARADDSRADAVRAGTDDRQFMINLVAGEQAVADRLAARGLGGDALKAELRKYRGDVFKASLIQRAVADPEGAAAWYQKNRGSFDPNDYAQIEAHLKAERDRRAALRLGDTLQSDGLRALAGPPGAVRVTPGVVEGQPYAIPAQFAPDVQAASAKHGVPVHILASLFYNESRYKPDARNPGDQRGTVNPATGRPYDSVGIGQWGEHWARARGFDPADPKASIDQTAATLAEHAKKYGGNWALARLAYGMGAGNVDAWLASGGDPNKLGPDIQRFVGQAVSGRDGQAAIDAFKALGPRLAGATGIPGNEVPTSTAPAEPRRADYIAAVEARFPAGSDPVQKAQALGAAESAFGRVHAVWKEGRDEALKKAVDWIEANPGAPLARMPAGLLLDLDTTMQAKVRAYHKTAGQVETDIPAFYNLQRMATSEDANVRRQFAALNLLEFKDKLSKADFEQAAGWQGAIRKGDPEGHIPEASGLHQQLATAKRMIGIDPSPKDNDKDGAKKNYDFDRAVQAQLELAFAAKGRKLTWDERQAIIDRQALDIPTGGGMFGGGTARRYELNDIKTLPSAARKTLTDWRTEITGPLKAPDVTDADLLAGFAAAQTHAIPPTQVPKIIAALRRNKVPIGDGEIIAYWRAWRETEAAREAARPKAPTR